MPLSRKARALRVIRARAELTLDGKEPVVFGDALRAGACAGLYHAHTGRDGQVCDRGVFGLAGAVRDHSRITRSPRGVDGVQGLCEGADLVDLDQDGVRDPLLDPLLKPVDVGDEEVVAHELDLASKAIRE